MLVSHDGFGLGHTRRNFRIADALVTADPSARVTLVSGLAVDLPWELPPRTSLAALSPLVKDSEGVYRNAAMDFDRVLADRRRCFDTLVGHVQPDVILVDRHPFGIGGEFADGLERARAHGATLVLGLRDVLDEPRTVRDEIAGRGWNGVTETFHEALVYGSDVLVDHHVEYGLPLNAFYCGWVAPRRSVALATPEPNHLLVTMGGGGDGDRLIEFTRQLLDAVPTWQATVIVGPYDRSIRRPHPRLSLVASSDGYDRFLSTAGAVIQMAGYNSTVESISAGIKPILWPRRFPRREQAIRATRLSALGLADMIDEGAAPDEIGWLLERPHRLAPEALAEAGLTVNGAERAARRLISLVDFAAARA